MGRQSSITQEQIVSFQQRVKEVTGWLRLRDEIAIDYLEKTDKSLSFDKREEQALSIFSEYYRTLKAPKETFSEGNKVISLYPYDKESWKKIAEDNGLELGEKMEHSANQNTDLHPWHELERLKKAREELLEQRDKIWGKSVITDEYMPKRPSRKDISALYRKGVQVIGRTEQRLFNTVLGCVVLGALVFCSIVFGIGQTINYLGWLFAGMLIFFIFIFPIIQVANHLARKIWKTRSHEIWNFFKK